MVFDNIISFLKLHMFRIWNFPSSEQVTNDVIDLMRAQEYLTADLMGIW